MWHDQAPLLLGECGRVVVAAGFSLWGMSQAFLPLGGFIHSLMKPAMHRLFFHFVTKSNLTKGK
jgi:hypothetical protein